jgi:hypothetical protein
MVEVFKSPLNLAKDTELARADVVPLRATSDPVPVPANSSVHVRIAFERVFERAPFVVYSIVCRDKLFDLVHYICDMGAKSFDVCIENHNEAPREITIMYEASAK